MVWGLLLTEHTLKLLCESMYVWVNEGTNCVVRRFDLKGASNLQSVYHLKSSLKVDHFSFKFNIQRRMKHLLCNLPRKTPFAMEKKCSLSLSALISLSAVISHKIYGKLSSIEVRCAWFQVYLIKKHFIPEILFSGAHISFSLIMQSTWWLIEGQNFYLSVLLEVNQYQFFFCGRCSS